LPLGMGELDPAIHDGGGIKQIETRTRESGECGYSISA
jgi:hypothetical protein